MPTTPTPDIAQLEATMRDTVLVELDYLEIVDPRTLRPIQLGARLNGTALALVAVIVGRAERGACDERRRDPGELKAISMPTPQSRAADRSFSGGRGR